MSLGSYYNHCPTLNIVSPITLNLTHLDIILYGPPQHVSIYSTFRVLRACPRLQRLSLFITNVLKSKPDPVM